MTQRPKRSSSGPAGTGSAAEAPPLKISCTTARCDDGLHCFKATKKLRDEGREGACRACGIELVSWDRVHARRLDDIDHTFTEMRREFIRHHFWHEPFDQKALDHAARKGRPGLHQAARRRLESSVGKEAGAWDGRQTPFGGSNTIHYAQHGVAACCRTCISYWHDIPRDRSLTDDELDYLHALVVRYLDERLPDLPDEPQKIPPRRRRP